MRGLLLSLLAVIVGVAMVGGGIWGLVGAVTDDDPPVPALPAPPPTAIFAATRPATIDRSSGEKCDMLIRTCSVPKTASTISCTL